MASPVLRLFRFRPAAPEFDNMLRTVLVPDMLRLPGILAVFAGRSGFEADGPRLVASLWESREAMASAVGADFSPAVFHPELLSSTTERTLEALPVALSFPPDRASADGIVRVVRGRTRPGALDDYVAAARDGTTGDMRSGNGPQALFLATQAPDGFVTLSLWESWERVEAATGADHEQVDRTRHAELLESWTAEHYEVVPGISIAGLPQTERQTA
jgi:heme-degrading monooxygenase HmoA